MAIAMRRTAYLHIKIAHMTHMSDPNNRRTSWILSMHLCS